MKNIVCFSSIRWDFMFQRPQHIMKGLSQYNKVYYINPRHGLREATGQSKNGLSWKEKRVQDNLIIYTPPYHIPFTRYPLLKKIDDAIIINKLKSIYKANNENIYWITDINCNYGLLEYMKTKGKLVFDYLDDYEYFPWVNDTNRNNIRDKICWLAKNADIVVATAPKLLEDSITRGAGKAILIQNGCDYSYFSSVQEKGKSKDIVIGYIGAIHEWFDTDLIYECARTMPNWKFEIVGSVRGEHDKLKGLNNIIMHGKQIYEDLSKYMEKFDVCLIPFKINPLTIATDPIKLYEYFATGKPVVSTPMPEVMKYNKLVYIANNAEEFVKAIGKALTEPDILKKERKCVAKLNSWENRVIEINKFLNL